MPDADNINKPICDALEGSVYDNDKQIQMRTAFVYDIGSASNNNEKIFNLFPKRVQEFALDEKEKHLLYIQITKLNDSNMLNLIQNQIILN